MRDIIVVLEHGHETRRMQILKLCISNVPFVDLANVISLPLTVSYKMPVNEFHLFLCAVSNVGQCLTRFVLKVNLCLDAAS